MKVTQALTIISKPQWLKSSVWKAVIRSNRCTMPRFISSSESIKSTDVELSYSLYPTNGESSDPKQAPLVFLHGLFGSKGNLHSVSKHISSSGRKVVTFDARNHGSSGHTDEFDFLCMAQDLRDLVNELNLDKPSILGHSLGGKTAMTYALENLDNISSLIVADVSPENSPGLNQLDTYIKAMKNASIPQNDGLVKARRAVQIQLTSDVPDRSILSFLLTNLIQLEDGTIKWRINLDALENKFGVYTAFPLLDTVPFSKPTLFVFGENSQHYKQADKGLIKSLFPTAHIEVIPDAGHFVHAEKPVEFVNIVQEFLKSQDSRE